MSEFFATLAALNREESLRRDTTLWKAVVSWLGSDSVCEKWKDTEIFKVAKDYLHESIKGELFLVQYIYIYIYFTTAHLYIYDRYIWVPFCVYVCLCGGRAG